MRYKVGDQVQYSAPVRYGQSTVDYGHFTGVVKQVRGNSYLIICDSMFVEEHVVREKDIYGLIAYRESATEVNLPETPQIVDPALEAQFSGS